MLKFATLKDEVNANALRNAATGSRPDLDYFTRNLEGKKLEVAAATATLAEIVDAKGEHWETPRTNLDTVPTFNSVGQEITNKMRA